MHVYTYVYTHAHSHACSHTPHRSAYAHTHMNTCTFAHKYTHTWAHTFTQLQKPCFFRKPHRPGLYLDHSMAKSSRLTFFSFHQARSKINQFARPPWNSLWRWPAGPVILRWAGIGWLTRPIDYKFLPWEQHDSFHVFMNQLRPCGWRSPFHLLSCFNGNLFVIK